MFSSHLTWLLSGIWPSWLLPVPWGSFLIWIGFHDASLSRVVILCLWWPLLSFVCEMFILYLSLRCWSPWGPFLLLSCIFHPHGLSEKSYSRFWLPHTSWRCPLASPLPLFKIFDSLLNMLPKSTRTPNLLLWLIVLKNQTIILFSEPKIWSPFYISCPRTDNHLPSCSN